MKTRLYLLQLNDQITIAKIICLTLLFSPLFGFWWFEPDPNGLWPLLVSIKYLLQSIPLGIIYVSICLLAVISFVIVTFIRPAFIRVPLMLGMLIGWAFELSLLDLNGFLSNQNLLWLMLLERPVGPEVLGSYAPHIVRDCVIVVMLGVVLSAPPARRFSVSGVFGVLPILSGALVAGVILYTKGGTQTFPIPFGTFSNAAIVLIEASHGPNRGLQLLDPALGDNDYLANGVVTMGDAKFEGPVQPIFSKIVMIMDESVRGDSLSLNDATHNTTPFLKSTNHLVNFGVAISGGNCSVVSRMIFRFGMRQSDLPDRWHEGLSKPTLWQFAHKAGYKTVHIDAWYGSVSLGNGFSRTEKALINSNISIINNPSYLRDQLVADELLRTLKNEDPTFIYVEKFGPHFPYSNKYPPDFHAATSNHESSTVWSIGAFLRSFLPPYDRELAHYPNAIAWSVDEFFRRLLPGVDLSKTLIIYTSDHGQSLLPGRFTHCSMTPNAPPGEAYVPLFAITSMPDFEQRLEKEATLGFGRFSHFEIFPTLLLAMGYDADWVNKAYGASLMDPPSPNRKFMIGSPGFQPMMIQADENLVPTSSSVEVHHASRPPSTN